MDEFFKKKIFLSFILGDKGDKTVVMETQKT